MKSDAQTKLKELLTSRKFWATLASFLAVTFGYTDLTPEVQASLIILILSGYTVATGIQSGLDSYGNGDINLRDKLKGILVSRKAWAAVASVLVAIGIELPPEFSAAAVSVVSVAYSLGTAIETGLRTRS